MHLLQELAHLDLDYFAGGALWSNDRRNRQRIHVAR